MRKFLIYLSVLSLFLLTGCLSDLSKLTIGNVESAKMVSVSLTSLDLVLGVDINNGSRTEFEVIGLDVSCRQISGLSIALSDTVILQPGRGRVDVPIRVCYSLGTVFSLVEASAVEEYTLDINVMISYGKSKKTLKLKRNISKDQLKNFVKNVIS